jgi:hypothetical protein
VVFVVTQETIQKGGDKDLPALCDLLKEKEFEGCKISIEGHVNFGQSAADAKKLSEVPPAMQWSHWVFVCYVDSSLLGPRSSDQDSSYVTWHQQG